MEADLKSESGSEDQADMTVSPYNKIFEASDDVELLVISNQTDPSEYRLLVPLIIAGASTKALIDTGASISFVHRRLAESLSREDYPITPPRTGQDVLRLGHESATVSRSGSVCLPFQWGHL